MKKFSILFLGIIALSSCSKEIDPDIMTQNPTENISPEIELVTIQNPSLKSSGADSETVIKFRDEEVLNKTKRMLQNMTLEEQKEWIAQLGGFESLKDIYNQAMLEAESYYDREGGYEEFKNQYPMFYYPEEGEDYGAYLPYIDESLASITNEYGNIMIGDQVIHEPSITTYAELQQTGNAYYQPENNKSLNNELTINNLRASTNFMTIYACNIDPGDTPGTKLKVGTSAFENVMDWREVGDGKKIRVTFGRITRPVQNGVLPYGFRLDWHVEISFRKKGWFGKWYNYSSETSCQFTIKEPGAKTGKHSLIYNRNTISGSSSHDYYVNATCNRYQRSKDLVYSKDKTKVFDLFTTSKDRNYVDWIYYMPGYEAALKITYRGMPYTLTLTFTNPGFWGYTETYGDKLRN